MSLYKKIIQDKNKPTEPTMAGVSEPKDADDGQNVVPKAGNRPLCLGIQCTHTSYQELNGTKFMWCGYLVRSVIDIQVCPFGAWAKDEQGFLISDSPEHRIEVNDSSQPMAEPEKVHQIEQGLSRTVCPSCGGTEFYEVGNGGFSKFICSLCHPREDSQKKDS